MVAVVAWVVCVVGGGVLAPTAKPAVGEPFVPSARKEPSLVGWAAAGTCAWNESEPSAPGLTRATSNVVRPSENVTWTSVSGRGGGAP